MRKITFKLFNVNNKELRIPVNGSHDVIVIKHDGKNKKSIVKTITSLEHWSNSFKHYSYDFISLKNFKTGKIVPIPIKDLGSHHWSGVYQKYVEVDDSALQPAKYCSKVSLPVKYRKLVK